MPGTYVTDFRHLTDNDGNPHPNLPKSGRDLAAFLGFIIEAVTAGSANELYSKTDIRCRQKGCNGKIQAALTNDDEITWACPDCDDNGVVHHWQGSQWDASK